MENKYYIRKDDANIAIIEIIEERNDKFNPNIKEVKVVEISCKCNKNIYKDVNYIWIDLIKEKIYTKEVFNQMIEYFNYKSCTKSEFDYMYNKIMQIDYDLKELKKKYDLL